MLGAFCAFAALAAGCGERSPEPALWHRLSNPRLTSNAGFPSPAEAVESAAALHAAGSEAEAFALLGAAHRRYPDDPGLLSAYGRQAVLMGEDELAELLLARALAANPNDWRALSAQGVLDERGGQHVEARGAMLLARSLSAQEPVVLNNLGISYLIEARAAEAAAVLRQALASPALKPAHAARMKRNLAVAVAVQGDFDLAERLAGERLPRALKQAGGEAIARFMGLPARTVARAGGWTTRLADASREFPRPGQ
ncbi:hypothetical protein [Rhodomicrobium vannielii]|nr:hypothetical protein [Rhodomicrobium vannielii]